jgi:predicted DCC family thiol-disulfide oxidoreductase YuxK
LSSKSIVLFDGVCNLCNGFVQFLLKKDRRNLFLFGSIQSEEGQALLKHFAPATADLTSIVFIDGGTVLTESDAVLAIGKRLGGIWGLGSWFRFIPKIIRDAMYRFIARHRYQLFGRREECMVPTPDIRKKFI